jgi:hypothetical protein
MTGTAHLLLRRCDGSGKRYPVVTARETLTPRARVSTGDRRSSASNVLTASSGCSVAPAAKCRCGFEPKFRNLALGDRTSGGAWLASHGRAALPRGTAKSVRQNCATREMLDCRSGEGRSSLKSVWRLSSPCVRVYECCPRGEICQDNDPAASRGLSAYLFQDSEPSSCESKRLPLMRQANVRIAMQWFYVRLSPETQNRTQPNTPRDSGEIGRPRKLTRKHI